MIAKTLTPLLVLAAATLTLGGCLVGETDDVPSLDEPELTPSSGFDWICEQRCNGHLNSGQGATPSEAWQNLPGCQGDADTIYCEQSLVPSAF